MRSTGTKRAALAAVLAVVAVVVGGSAGSSGASAPINAKHFFWAQGQFPPSPDALTNDIIYHGGSAGPGAIGIQKTPAVYLVYWGTEWAQGFTTADTDGRSSRARRSRTT
jgi:hypothetical protein